MSLLPIGWSYGKQGIRYPVRAEFPDERNETRDSSQKIVPYDCIIHLWGRTERIVAFSGSCPESMFSKTDLFPSVHIHQIYVRTISTVNQATLDTLSGRPSRHTVFKLSHRGNEIIVVDHSLVSPSP